MSIFYRFFTMCLYKKTDGTSTRCRTFVIGKVVPEVSVFLYKGIFCQIPLLLPQGKDILKYPRINSLHKIFCFFDYGINLT